MARSRLEVAVFSEASALLAQDNGAGRVELNANGSYPAGGTTPALDTLTSLSPQMQIPVRIMIRPRGPPSDGSPDFIYSKEEFEAMKRDVKVFVESKSMNLARGDGLVFGILRPGDAGHLHVDVERCSQLTQLAHPFPCVFHRAFDPIAAKSDWEAGLADLETSGCRGLLTAGGAGNMRDNLDCLANIAVSSKQIQLVAGGGLRSYSFSQDISNLISQEAGDVWLHTAALRKGNEEEESVDPEELKALLDKMVS